MPSFEDIVKAYEAQRGAGAGEAAGLVEPVPHLCRERDDLSAQHDIWT